MSKSRRDIFEDQVRALQDDISSLNKKLSLSSMLTPKLREGSLYYYESMNY
jgi:hypothetical protein